MTKEELRSKLRAKRRAMSTEQVEALSELAISNLFKAIDFKKLGSLHTYIPISSLRELNSWPILTHAWQTNQQLLTAVSGPGLRGRQVALKINPATKWRGIYPKTDFAVPADFQFDVIFVPTLAFDEKLYRLGWGSGFYDHFLTGQKKARKIGLCFSDYQVGKIPHQPHDIKLDAIVTDKGIIGQI